MKARLLRLADKLRQSYWFIPSLMAFAAMLLAGGMVWLDSHEGSRWMDGLPWLYASRPSGARQVLSAIGGSMITVAGTVFSVTIAAVVYASGQYGPRLLSNFMRDRGNQITLGTFIATFLYCLIVLRTIRSPDESAASTFVPNLALLVGMLLAICSIAVLIFFIHHVPSKIHINSVIDDIGHRLLHEVGNRFPRFIGSPADAQEDQPHPPLPAAFAPGVDNAAVRAIPARETGYVQLVRDDELLRLASEHDMVLRLRYQPGDFVHVGRTVMEVWPPEACDDALCQSLAGTFAIGSQRTALQDIRFLIDELVEIAARALSPGVNDPFTAITCIDWLGAAMSDLAQRDIPSRLREDEDGALRVIAHPQTFDQFVDRGFGALAQYCAGDRIAALHFLRTLSRVALALDDRDRLKRLRHCVERLQALTEDKLEGLDRGELSRHAKHLRSVLADPHHKTRLRTDSL